MKCLSFLSLFSSACTLSQFLFFFFRMICQSLVKPLVLLEELLFAPDKTKLISSVILLSNSYLKFSELLRPFVFVFLGLGDFDYDGRFNFCCLMLLSINVVSGKWKLRHENEFHFFNYLWIKSYNFELKFAPLWDLSHWVLAA